MDHTENVIDFITGSRTATATFTNRKYINRMKKLYEKHKDDFDYFIENKDGSVCARIPLKWIRISPGNKTGRIMSDEQKEAARIQLEHARSCIKKDK